VATAQHSGRSCAVEVFADTVLTQLETAVAELHRTLSHPMHIWLERFGARLMELHPAMGAVTAAQHAVQAHPEAAELEPEEAAELFVAEAPPGITGAPE
jgi:hypothetical protein